MRSWTHLERQRGGCGFLGGPGETQIEADRRMSSATDRADRSRTRQGQAHPPTAPRQPQARAVSDRRAGRLHQCRQVDAVQPLTRRPCCRPICCSRRSIRPCARSTLPHGNRIILSDTVGFISDLPTMLVAAFRATLEEVIEADVILHVRDMSHEDTGAQSARRRRGAGRTRHRAERSAASSRSGTRSIGSTPTGRERIVNLAERQPAESRPVRGVGLQRRGARHSHRRRSKAVSPRPS